MVQVISVSAPNGTERVPVFGANWRDNRHVVVSIDVNHTGPDPVKSQIVGRFSGDTNSSDRLLSVEYEGYSLAVVRDIPPKVRWVHPDTVTDDKVNHLWKLEDGHLKMGEKYLVLNEAAATLALGKQDKAVTVRFEDEISPPSQELVMPTALHEVGGILSFAGSSVLSTTDQGSVTGLHTMEVIFVFFAACRIGIRVANQAGMWQRQSDSTVKPVKTDVFSVEMLWMIAPLDDNAFFIGNTDNEWLGADAGGFTLSPTKPALFQLVSTASRLRLSLDDELLGSEESSDRSNFLPPGEYHFVVVVDGVTQCLTRNGGDVGLRRTLSSCRVIVAVDGSVALTEGGEEDSARTAEERVQKPRDELYHRKGLPLKVSHDPRHNTLFVSAAETVHPPSWELAIGTDGLVTMSHRWHVMHINPSGKLTLLRREDVDLESGMRPLRFAPQPVTCCDSSSKPSSIDLSFRYHATYASHVTVTNHSKLDRVSDCFLRALPLVRIDLSEASFSHIGSNVLSYTLLTTIDLSTQRLESIGSGFAAHCRSLRSIIFNKDSVVKHIGHNFLRGCISLEAIEGLRGKLCTIPDGFLAECTSLKTFDATSLNPTFVGDDFLSGCTSLQILRINDVKNVGNGFLHGCKHLSGGLEQLSAVDPDDVPSHLQKEELVHPKVWSRIVKRNEELDRRPLRKLYNLLEGSSMFLSAWQEARDQEDSCVRDPRLESTADLADLEALVRLVRAKSDRWVSGEMTPLCWMPTKQESMAWVYVNKYVGWALYNARRHAFEKASSSKSQCDVLFLSAVDVVSRRASVMRTPTGLAVDLSTGAGGMKFVDVFPTPKSLVGEPYKPGDPVTYSEAALFEKLTKIELIEVLRKLPDEGRAIAGNAISSDVKSASEFPEGAASARIEGEKRSQVIAAGATIQANVVSRGGQSLQGATIMCHLCGSKRMTETDSLNKHLTSGKHTKHFVVNPDLVLTVVCRTCGFSPVKFANVRQWEAALIIGDGTAAGRCHPGCDLMIVVDSPAVRNIATPALYRIMDAAQLVDSYSYSNADKHLMRSMLADVRRPHSLREAILAAYPSASSDHADVIEYAIDTPARFAAKVNRDSIITHGASCVTAETIEAIHLFSQRTWIHDDVTKFLCQRDSKLITQQVKLLALFVRALATQISSHEAVVYKYIRDADVPSGIGRGVEKLIGAHWAGKFDKQVKQMAGKSARVPAESLIWLWAFTSCTTEKWNPEKCRKHGIDTVIEIRTRFNASISSLSIVPDDSEVVLLPGHSLRFESMNGAGADRLRRVQLCDVDADPEPLILSAMQVSTASTVVLYDFYDSAVAEKRALFEKEKEVVSLWAQEELTRLLESEKLTVHVDGKCHTLMSAHIPPVPQVKKAVVDSGILLSATARPLECSFEFVADVFAIVRNREGNELVRKGDAVAFTTDAASTCLWKVEAPLSPLSGDLHFRLCNPYSSQQVLSPSLDRIVNVASGEECLFVFTRDGNAERALDIQNVSADQCKARMDAVPSVVLEKAADVRPPNSDADEPKISWEPLRTSSSARAFCGPMPAR